MITWYVFAVNDRNQQQLVDIVMSSDWPARTVMVKGFDYPNCVIYAIDLHDLDDDEADLAQLAMLGKPLPISLTRERPSSL